MATFRKRGERWEYRISYKDPFSHKHKVKSKSGFETKKEAQKAARLMEESLAEGNEQKLPSLKTYLNFWLKEHKEGTIRQNTYNLHEANIKNHILPYFKDINISELKPMMYQKFISHLTEQGYSRRTCEIVHTTMYNAMKKAKTLYNMQINPCEGVTIKGEKRKDEIKFIESDDIPRFLQESYKYGYIYWLFYKVLIETGMRKGEAAALQWEDIDLKEQTMNVTKTLNFQAKNEEQLLGDLKTYSSKRKITISKGLANGLHQHKKIQNQNKLLLNELYDHEHNFVLCRKDGTYMPKSSLFNSFSRILKRAEIPPLPIHSLRHTHAVLLLESGASMKYVQERLGHGSIQITSDVYAHISKKIDQNTMDKFENYTQSLLE